MKLSAALSSLAAALGAAQLVGVVITTPDIMTSNASFSLSDQMQTSDRAPASPVTSQTTVLVVEPVTVPSPHVAPHPPPQGHIFAAGGEDSRPGHACQITSHCPGGAESDEAFAAFRTQVGDVPGYCSFLSSEVSRRLDPGNGTG